MRRTSPAWKSTWMAVTGKSKQWHRLHRLRKEWFLSSRAKREICFSSPNPRKSRFLGQTQPFGMTRCEFFRSHFSLWGFVLARSKIRRLKPAPQDIPMWQTIHTLTFFAVECDHENNDGHPRPRLPTIQSARQERRELRPGIDFARGWAGLERASAGTPAAGKTSARAIEGARHARARQCQNQ
jgi:hypothetical protein